MTVETLLLIFVGVFCVMGTLYFGFGLADKRQQKEDFEIFIEDNQEFKMGLLQKLSNIEYYVSKKEDK